MLLIYELLQILNPFKDGLVGKPRYQIAKSVAEPEIRMSMYQCLLISDNG